MPGTIELSEFLADLVSGQRLMVQGKRVSVISVTPVDHDGTRRSTFHLRIEFGDRQREYRISTFESRDGQGKHE